MTSFAVLLAGLVFAMGASADSQLPKLRGSIVNQTSKDNASHAVTEPRLIDAAENQTDLPGVLGVVHLFHGGQHRGQYHAQYHGGFCVRRSVGWFCNGFTRVKCCRYAWGFGECGSMVHYRGCGFPGPWMMSNANVENASDITAVLAQEEMSVILNATGPEVSAEPKMQLEHSPVGSNTSDVADALGADEMSATLNRSTALAEVAHAQDMTSGEVDLSENATLASSGGFCVTRSVGWFCRGYTRVKCCRYRWGFGECGSMVNFRGCGWHGVR